MSQGIYSALSGAIAQQAALETTATNLANANTGGFRALRPVFEDVLARAGGGRERAHFSMVRQTAVDTTPGAVRNTNRPLDLALPKDAFLAVQREDGREAYTRAAALELDANGRLVTRSGHAVLDEERRTIDLTPGGVVTVRPTGEVEVDGEPVAVLRVVTFPDPKQMTYEGSTLLTPGAGAGEPTASTEPLTVGALEESNASPVRAMNELMMTTRVFEAMERAIGTFREVDQRLVTTVPK
jgi:flagellar basal body rod protein FlgG